MWRGFRPCTPDSIPLLGRAAPYRNLTVACGHGTIGMGLAPAAGELVAGIVAGETGRGGAGAVPGRPVRHPGRRPGAPAGVGGAAAVTAVPIGVIGLDTSFTKIPGHIRNPATSSAGGAVSTSSASAASPARRSKSSTTAPSSPTLEPNWW